MSHFNPLKIDLEHILSHTEAQWDVLRGERLFITGGTGFIGCWLLETFLWINQRLNLDASAVVLSRNPQKFAVQVPHLAQNPSIQLRAGDIQSFDFPDGSFSHIIHAAADASPQHRTNDPQFIRDTILRGTERVLAFAQQNGGKRLLFTSSGAVYGQQWHEHRLQESDILASRNEHPHTPYGQAKREAEQLCVQAARDSGMGITMARCFALAGPYLTLEGGYALGDFLRAGLNGHNIQIEGDGTPRRSYLYASDLMIWLWAILFQGQAGQAYNVGSEEAISILELAQQVTQCFTPTLGIAFKRPLNPGMPIESPAEWYVPDTQLARTELNLTQTVSLPEAIEKCIAWHQEQLGR